jgi:chromate transporter
MKPKLRGLFWGFLKIGAITIGGGYAMIPVIEHELVEKQKLLTHHEVAHLLTVAQSAPGPIAVNTALITGYRLRGIRGAAVSAFGAVLAPIGIMLIIAAFLEQVTRYPRVSSMFEATRTIVVALIASAGVKMTMRIGKWYVPLTASAIVALLLLTDFNPFFLVPIAAVIGGVSEAIKSKKEGRE